MTHTVGSFGAVGLNAVLISTFIASCVEMTEMVIIVVGVGAIRGWRSTLIGAGSGMVILIGIVFGLGQALALIPIDIVRIIIGALLLTFGLQWYRKGVIGVATKGFTKGEGEEVDAGAGGGGGLDWTAFVLAFKGVLLEGLEIAFIVVAFGAGGGGGSAGPSGGSYPSAYIGALAAFVLIGLIGVAARSKLEQVPGQSLKFGVGGLLSTFGAFWMLEGLGVHWPSGKFSLAWLYAAFLGSSFLAMRAVRAGWLGPRPSSGEPDPGAADPSGLAPASAASIREFQRAHGLQPDGVVGPRTRAAVLAVRRERGADRPDVKRIGVDPADGDAVRRLQERFGLPLTGDIDPMTRGALRVVQHPGVIDEADPDAVKQFQQQHGLPVSGRVDERTVAALVALRARGQAREGRDSAADPERHDPVRSAAGLDSTDEASVCRVQRAIGLRASGTLDDETRGALRALQALRLLPADFGDGDEPSPLDADAMRAFQRRHGLEPSGAVDEPTRQALRWEREHYASVDAADPDTVRRFQRRHGLEPDGVVGSRTQAALRAARAERLAAVPEDADFGARYGDASLRDAGRLLDPSDPDDVASFQRSHGLAVTGTVDEPTRAAILSVRSNVAASHATTGEEHPA